MALPEVRMSFRDRAALERELDQNLRHGRAFSNQASDIPVLSECVVVLVHPEHGEELRLPAQVVMVNERGPMCGIGLALRSFGQEEIARVQQFASSARTPAPLLAADDDEPAASSHGVKPTLELGEGLHSQAQLIEEWPAAYVDEAIRSGDASPQLIEESPAADIDATIASAAVSPASAQLIEESPAAGDDVVTQVVYPSDSNVQLIEESPAAGADVVTQVAYPSDPNAQLIEESPAADALQPMAAEEAQATVAEQPPSSEPDDAQTTPDAESAALLAEEDADFPICEERELTFDDDDAADGGDGQGRATELQSFNKQAKLRHLNAAQQLKVARTGELADRIAVERLYGKQVWDALLHNPRLSTPEVARIARKGTVPKPLLEVILENGAWIKADAVRRALLSNPKLSADAVLKLLRITPKHELKMMEKGTAYGIPVRDAARKLLKQ
jgi:hypothetical protein